MKNNFQDILKKEDLKVTPARLLILEVFSLCLCKPINAEFIYGKLKAKKINQVTIYRTLTSLEQAEIIKKVDLRKGSAYYELSGNHHHHIVCSDCGKTEGFEMCGVDKISKEILKQSSQFKTISQHSFELFGVCRSCSKG